MRIAAGQVGARPGQDPPAETRHAETCRLLVGPGQRIKLVAVTTEGAIRSGEEAKELRGPEPLIGPIGVIQTGLRRLE